MFCTSIEKNKSSWSTRGRVSLRLSRTLVFFCILLYLQTLKFEGFDWTMSLVLGIYKQKQKPLRLLYNFKKFSIWVSWTDPTARILAASNHPRVTTNPKNQIERPERREERKKKHPWRLRGKSMFTWPSSLSKPSDTMVWTVFDPSLLFRPKKMNRPNVSEAQILFFLLLWIFLFV